MTYNAEFLLCIALLGLAAGFKGVAVVAGVAGEGEAGAGQHHQAYHHLPYNIQ
jgi:hypothetical protein